MTGERPLSLSVNIQSFLSHGLLVGDVTLPAVGDVEAGVEYGAGGDELTGTFSVPSESEVLIGVGYGEGETEFVGILDRIMIAGGGRTASIVSAIQALLTTDASLISRLATYDFGNGQEPAIFTTDPAPENCPAPHITISQDLGVSGSGSRAGRSVNVGGTITTWGENTPSGQELEAVGWDIWRILDRGEITTEQFGEILLTAGPPQNTTDPDGYPGRIVNWSAEAHETILT